MVLPLARAAAVSTGLRVLIGNHGGAIAHEEAGDGAVVVRLHLGHGRVEAHLATARLEVVRV